MINNTITFNKNRGWRGLCSAKITHNQRETTTIFSFSPEVWDDLINKKLFIAPQTDDTTWVYFLQDPENRLPKPTQQRSVLIKNVTLPIERAFAIKNEEWHTMMLHPHDYIGSLPVSSADEALDIVWAISHTNYNTNNHTKSRWNDVGIRVIPVI